MRARARFGTSAQFPAVKLHVPTKLHTLFGIPLLHHQHHTRRMIMSDCTRRERTLSCGNGVRAADPQSRRAS